MRSFHILAAVALAEIILVLPLMAADGVQPSSASIASEPLPNEATQLIAPAELRGYSILGCLETLQKRKGIAISLDRAGLETVCKQNLREIKVYQIEFSLPLAAAVEYLAIQVHGTLRIRGKAMHIVAGDGDMLRFLSPPAKKDPIDLQKQLTIEKPIQSLPGCDIIDFVSEKLEMPILVAPEPFDCKPENTFHKRTCTLPNGTKELRAWLNSMALQMRGQIVMRQEAVVLAPAGRAN